MNFSASANASGSRRMTRSFWRSLSLTRRPHTIQTGAAGSNSFQSWKKRAIQMWRSTPMSLQNHVLGRVAWFKHVPAMSSLQAFLSFSLIITYAHIGLGVRQSFFWQACSCLWPHVWLLSFDLPLGRDAYTIRPKSMEMHFSWGSPNTNQLKYMAIASTFPEKAWELTWICKLRPRPYWFRFKFDIPILYYTVTQFRLKLLVSSLEYHAKKRSAVLLVGKMVFLKWPQDLGHQRNSSWHQLLDSSSSLDVWQAMPQYKMWMCGCRIVLMWFYG